MLWHAVCTQAIFKPNTVRRIGEEDIAMPVPTPFLRSLSLSLFLHPSIHPYLLCLYYGCYYYSCMSSCRPRFSPSPEQESGHYWHPARLPNQSPLREGGGRREGGKRREGGGGIRKRVWSQRGKERKSEVGWRMVKEEETGG